MRPAVLMLKMFCSGCSSLDRVGSASICSHVSPQSYQNPATRPAYHLDRGVGKVNKLGKDLAIFSRRVQLGGIPQGQHRPYKLGKAFCPGAVRIRSPLCPDVSKLPQRAVQGFLFLTEVLVIQLQKVALLVQFVGVGVEEAEDGLELGRGVGVDVHHVRAVRLDQRQRAGASFVVAGAVAVGARGW